MSANSSIEWTDRTWNPVRGCSVISPGCVNCYAMKQAHRFSGDGKPYAGLTKLTSAGPQWTGRVEVVSHAIDEPLSWRKPQRVFVNSMADLFHEGVRDIDITRILAVMALASQHTFQVLTKRADRMREYMTHPGRHADVVFKRFPDLREADRAAKRIAWPLPNVWLGVSVENQKYADERIPLLLQTPAAIRFISAEPLLGPVNLRGHFFSPDIRWPGKCAACGNGHGFTRCPNYGSIAPTYSHHRGGPVVCEQFRKVPGSGIDWVIVGGESGNGARPFDTSFARSIVKQCADAGVACFIKQLGAKPEQPAPGAWNTAQREPMVLVNHKGGDITEWPEDLRVRQYPEARA